VHGTGQHIEPDSRSPELHAVVVFPEGRCDTARVYRRFDERSRHAAALRTAEIESLRASAPTQNLSELLFNDLTDAAIDTAPELRELLRDLTRVAERLAHVTGSGSSMFIICDDPLHAQALAAAIEQRLNLPVVAVRKYEPAHETTVH
jgi:4-diphosphocytidyl-2-C-methyl-D-erythritol kinase